MTHKLISGIKFARNWASWILEDGLGMDITPIEVDRKYTEVTITGILKFHLQFDLWNKFEKYMSVRWVDALTMESHLPLKSD